MPNEPGDIDLSQFLQDDPDPSGALTLAIHHKHMFDAYMEVGFTREEALQLTCCFLTSMALTPPDPND